jgi:hypothetical protein
MTPALIVIAKEPVAGRVKTRLCPPFTSAQAAWLAEAALADTLRTVLDTPARERVLVLDGNPGGWLPDGFTVVPQIAGPLEVRLAAAFAVVADVSPGPALLIGMDTPQVDPDHLSGDWADADALLGPAEDGGFWALGLRDPSPALAARVLHGVPMSRSDTGARQLARLVTAGMRTRFLPMLRDVDTAEDAFAVAAQRPDGRFAKRLGNTTAGAPVS